MRISRREWARLLVRGSVGYWVCGRFEGFLGKPVLAQGSVDVLLEPILNNPDRRQSYGELGAACLRSIGGREPEVLRDRLREEINRSLEREAGISGASDTFDGFRRAVRRDFAEGRTLEVSGWLLSRTEASLCALVALVSGRSAP